jgi:hypothetical protein
MDNIAADIALDELTEMYKAEADAEHSAAAANVMTAVEIADTTYAHMATQLHIEEQLVQSTLTKLYQQLVVNTNQLVDITNVMLNPALPADKGSLYSTIISDTTSDDVFNIILRVLQNNGFHIVYAQRIRLLAAIEINRTLGTVAAFSDLSYYRAKTNLLDALCKDFCGAWKAVVKNDEWLLYFAKSKLLGSVMKRLNGIFEDTMQIGFRDAYCSSPIVGIIDRRRQLLAHLDNVHTFV